LQEIRRQSGPAFRRLPCSFCETSMKDRQRCSSLTSKR